MSGTTTTTTNVQLTPLAQQAAASLFGRAQEIANQPYVPYTGERVAGFTPDQTAAFDAARQVGQAGGDIFSQQQRAVANAVTPGLVGQSANLAAGVGNLAGMGQGVVGQAVPATLGLAQTFPNANIQQYMNPHTQAVLDPALEDIARRAAVEQNALRARQAQTGSFGGSRGAIAEQELNRNVMGELGRVSANERARAFNEAANQFRLDQQRIPELYSAALGQIGLGQQLGLAGQGALANVAGLENMGLSQLAGLSAANLSRLQSQVNPLLATGGLQQALSQSQLDVPYQQYVEQRDWPLRGLSALQGALGIQAGQTTTATRQEPRPNPTAQTIGSVIGGISAIPGVVGGLSSLYNLGSRAYNWFNSPSAGTWGADQAGGLTYDVSPSSFGSGWESTNYAM